MLERLKTAIPLIILFALCFVLPGAYGLGYFSLFAALALILANHEIYAMLQLPRPFEIGADISALISVASCLAWSKHELLPVLCLVHLLISVVILFYMELTKENLQSMFLGLGVFLYLNCTMLYAQRLYCLGEGGRLMLLALIIMTKMGDVGAYVCGTLTHRMMKNGNHKLAPVISPKKSWEGLAGGILFSVATALVIFHCFPKMLMLVQIKLAGPLFNAWEMLAWGVVVAVIGLVGDLAESAVKRVANMKDSGHLPGIGGVLDVLDSLILVVPLFYFHVAYKLVKWLLV